MVILENPDLNNVYVVDFSPVEDISKPDVLFRMFTGNNIKGKLRVFHVEKKNIINELGKTQKLHDLNEIKNYNMDIYNIINNWNTSFNVYNHNCKDFSKYLIKSFNLLTI
jgi:hypothetical protein